MFKKILIWVVCLLLLFNGCSSQQPVKTEATLTATAGHEAPRASSENSDAIYLKADAPIEDRVTDLLSRMSLEEKIGQMVQAEASYIQPEEVAMHYVGSVMSGGGHAPGDKTASAWQNMIVQYQRAAGSTKLRIPIFYGVDAIHGMAKFREAVVFPHQSGIGAIGDLALVEKVGQETAKQMLMCGVTWDFSPSVSVVEDIRWGRTYESFGEDSKHVVLLSTAYMKGLHSLNVMATPKHFFGDGAVEWDTGLCGYHLDKGNFNPKSDIELKEQLAPYKA
ncbi:MAG: hypothetical protein N2376_05885, partial [Clostridia bacterium]|nr:hypothetical protein [Clostridia bacterium]